MNNMNRELCEAVQELENQRAALDLHSIVCVFGIDGRVLDINDKFADITAFHKDGRFGARLQHVALSSA